MLHLVSEELVFTMVIIPHVHCSDALLKPTVGGNGDHLSPEHNQVRKTLFTSLLITVRLSGGSACINLTHQGGKPL